MRNGIYIKIPKMNLFKNLSAQPAARPASPSPLSPARGARLAPPGAGHVAAVRRRWTRRGRPAYTWSGRRPAPPDPPLHSVARLSLSLLPPRASSSSRGDAPPCAIGAEAQRSTPVTRARLNPPLALPRRAQPCAHIPGQQRPGVR